MALRKTMLSLAALSLPITAAVAQEANPDRYSLERSEGGFVRLDRQTDERAAYDADLARLEKRVEALENQIAGATPGKSGDMPSDAEIDRSIGIMERFMRAFFNLVQKFQGEEQRSEPGEIPDRT